MNMAYRNIVAPWFLILYQALYSWHTGLYFESTTGQSIGKRVLHLRTTDLDGKTIDVKTAAIESFGKAFLLPIDVVVRMDIYQRQKAENI